MNKTEDMNDSNNFNIPISYSQENTGEQLKYLLENDDLLTMIEHFLKGDVINWETRKYESKFESKANMEGINHILSRLTPHAHKNIMLSHMKKENVNAIVKQFARNFARDIVLYSEDWGIKDRDITMIWEFVTNMVYAAFCRGEEGIEKRFLKGTIHMGFQENNYGAGNGFANPGNKQNMYNKFNPFNKNNSGGGGY